MLARTVFLAALLWLSFAGLAQAQNDASSPQGGDLSFYVFVDGRPVPEATVRMNDALIGATDEGGVLFAEVAPGDYTVKVEHKGQVLVDSGTTVSPGENARIIVAVNSKNGRVDIDLETSHPDNEKSAQTDQRPEQPDQDLPPGELAGVVTSAEDGAPVEGARVYVRGAPVDTRTDAQGQFRAELPPGSYGLSVVHASFATRTLDNIVIESEATTRREIEVTPAGARLPEFVVTEPYIEGSLASTIEQRQKASGVTDLLSAEQISRSGDSDAAGALKRVTGLSLVDGKFIYVRGLGERYSSTLLNGAIVPSPDPTRRVVPLDLFPADILSTVLVQKSYSADNPGEFGGGTVALKTKSIPEESFLSVSISGGFQDNSTGETGLRYDGGDSDWLGEDDGTRALPDSVREAVENSELIASSPFRPGGYSQEELEAFGEALPAIYKTEEFDIPPGYGLGLAGGYRQTLGDKWTLGFQAAVDYSRDIENRIERRVDYTSGVGDELEILNDFTHNRTLDNVSLSGFLTAGARYGEEHSIDFTSMVLRETTDETEVYEGLLADALADVRFTELFFERRQLIANQLSGSHSFEDNAYAIDWGYTTSKAMRRAPDQRIYRYDADLEGDFSLSRRPDSNQRIYSTLDDVARNYFINLTIPGEFGEWLDYEFKGGFNFLRKSRESDIRRFRFSERGPLANDPDLRESENLEDIINDDTIDPRGWQLQESTLNTDNYFASQTLDAHYGSMDLTFVDTWRVYAGVRVEDNFQSVTTFELFSNDAEPTVATLGNEDFLPTVALTWLINDGQQLRFSAADTVSRPDFKELSEAAFRDPRTDDLVVGNPDLEQTDIRHYDLRYEHYFEGANNFSVALFAKQFERPIERVILPGASGIVSFNNADEAENVGIELDFYHDLAFLGGFWERFYVTANYSWIDSEIILSEEDAGVQTNTTRPLQGQSPYVANLQLGYDDDLNSATLLFNSFGERIVDVGILGQPDTLEQPFQQLDFVYGRELSESLKLSVKLKNLLDGTVEFRQGGQITRQYDKGREISLGLKWTPF